MDTMTLQERVDGALLRDKVVALTGRLGSLRRSAAMDLIRQSGGRYSRLVTRSTDLLVIGQDGWPLRADGRLARNLQRARRLQSDGVPIQILREDEFLDRLGLHGSCGGIHARHTLSDLTRIAGVPVGRIRTWIRAGLLPPAERRHGIDYFDFRQVTVLRTLDQLVRGGVSTARLRRSLEQLRSWIPDVEHAVARLSLLDGTGRITVRSDDGRLLEASGQQLLDFGEDVPAPAVRLEQPDSPDDLFERAVELEDVGRLDEAAEAWQQWLLRFGPDAVVCFNLANVLYASGHPEAALERFRQAVEIDPDYLEAWSNLGSVLAETGRPGDAVAAFERALRIEPRYENALYNLADTLEELGRDEEARGYWQAYLNAEQIGPWAEYARTRLAQ